MAIKENPSQNIKQIYYKDLDKWVPVDEATFRSINNYNHETRRKAQKNGHCACPRIKWWRCDSSCPDCEFNICEVSSTGKKIISLDRTYEQADGDSMSLYDITPSPEQIFVDIIADNDELRQLFQRFSELLPHADIIVPMLLDDKPITAIAETLGMKRTTLNSRLNKARAILKQEYYDNKNSNKQF